MSGDGARTHLRVDVRVHRARNVVSLTFTPASERSEEEAPAQPVLRAVRLVEAGPNVVMRLDEQGRLLGIDVFEAASVFGMERLEDVSFTLRTEA